MDKEEEKQIWIREKYKVATSACIEIINYFYIKKN